MDDNHSSPSPSPSPSLKSKIRSSACFSCCFRSSSDHPPPSLLRSSSTYIDKCRALISCVGKNHHHRRGQSADFRYDPLSYALNFDDGEDGGENGAGEEVRYRNFSARLPASPPMTAAPSALSVAYG